MIKLTCECTYCGYTWNLSAYSDYDLERTVRDLYCPHGNCRERKIKVRRSRSYDQYDPNFRPDGFEPMKDETNVPKTKRSS